jgi:hypothetical protein
MTSAPGDERFGRAGLPTRPLVVLNHYGAKFILKFVWLYNGRRIGLGPRPNPDATPYTPKPYHITSLLNRWRLDMLEPSPQSRAYTI